MQNKFSLPWRVVNDGLVYDADDRLVLQVFEQEWSLRPRSQEETKEIADQIVDFFNKQPA